MSDLLQQAMIDAAALREAAIKNAENALIEKYSQEFNQTVQKLLEQEAAAPAPTDAAAPPADPMATAAAPADPAAASADAAATDPMAAGADPMAGASPGAPAPTKKDAFSKVPGSFSGDDDELITINFDQIRATLNEMMGVSEEEMDEAYDTKGEDMARDALHSEPDTEVVTIKYSAADSEEESEEELELEDEQELEYELEEADAAVAGQALKAQGAQQIAKGEQLISQGAAEDAKKAEKAAATPVSVEEDIELTEEELQELAEELRVDLKVGNLSDGYMGSTETQKREQRNVELAAARDEKAAKAREEELEKMKDLMQENASLKKINNSALKTLETLKEQLEKLSLSNAKLLYTNKALGNISLNERQKTTIVESISKADSVLAAKTIYESVQNAVENVAKEKEAPQSLRETLNRAATPFVVKKSRVNNIDDIMAQRMKALAGIKK